MNTEIILIKHYGPYAHLRLQAPAIARRAQPGQFVEVRLAGEGAPFWRRPFSVCRVAGQAIELLVKAVGPGSRLLCALRAGQTVDVIGPLGRGFSLSGPEPRILVGGGYGVVPLLFLAERLLASGRQAEVLLGGRRREDLVLRSHFQHLRARVACATEDGSFGVCGLVTGLLEKRLQEAKTKIRVAACGPRGMLAAVARLAAAHGSRAEVSLEEVMACGLGVCNGCAVKTTGGFRPVCADGPVFPAEEIDWE